MRRETGGPRNGVQQLRNPEHICKGGKPKKEADIQIGELLEDEEIIVRTIALITLFKVVLAKNAAIIDEATMARIVSKNLAIIMDKV